jgi:hypothetical protein
MRTTALELTHSNPMLETFQSPDVTVGALGTDSLFEQGTMLDCLMIM